MSTNLTIYQSITHNYILLHATGSLAGPMPFAYTAHLPILCHRLLQHHAALPGAWGAAETDSWEGRCWERLHDGAAAWPHRERARGSRGGAETDTAAAAMVRDGDCRLIIPSATANLLEVTDGVLRPTALRSTATADTPRCSHGLAACYLLLMLTCALY